MRHTNCLLLLVGFQQIQMANNWSLQTVIFTRKLFLSLLSLLSVDLAIFFSIWLEIICGEGPCLGSVLYNVGLEYHKAELTIKNMSKSYDSDSALTLL